MATKPSLSFKVDRSEPVLIAPSKATPYELKPLSDLDDHKGFWRHSHGIELCENVVGMEGIDPVEVIKNAVADTLVFFYPLAGRLREGANGKIIVECNGEGVLFVQANAHVRLEEFAGLTLPPVPCADDLLWDVPGSSNILNTPLLLIQVTRMLCGGYSFAIRVNHMMCDAIGLFQFLTALSEIALGADVPSITPVWQRELLYARNPLRVSCEHHSYIEMKRNLNINQEQDKMVICSLFFGLQEISNLRNNLPPPLRKCSNFDMLSALFWRCRTISECLNSDEVMRLSIAVNARTKLNPPLPAGYYGNAFVAPVALSTAGELCKNSLGYALELVRKAKAEVTEEFVRSTIDFVVKNGRPYFADGLMCVSDLTSMVFDNVDIGYGKPLYRGTLSLDPRITFFVPTKNKKGEKGTAGTIRLPESAMKRFIMEIEKMVKLPKTKNSSFIVSTL